MRAALDDAPGVEDEDEVGVQDGGEAVDDGDRRAAGHQRRQGVLVEGFGLRVERVRRLVEDETGGDLRVTRARARRWPSPQGSP